MRQKRFQRAWLALSLAGILLAIAWAQRPNQEDAPFSPVEDSTALARALQALGQDFPRESPALPSFCADRLGQTWAVWEDWGPEPNRIKLTRFKDGRVSLLQDLAGPAGFNMTPRLAFDSTHAPWVIWMNYLNGNHRVFVQDLSSGRLWQLNSGHSASVASPQLVFDGEGNAWAFWNETWPDNGVIAYRVFNQSFWSPQQNFRPENGYPALNPDAAVDHTGTLWVAWASYDGHDYELFLARRTRNGWEKEARITDNLENDVFPALFMGKEGPPLVAWTQSTEYGHQVCAAPLGRGFLKGATAISSPAPSMAVPRLFKDRGETHVVWKSSGALRLRRISPRPFDREEPSRPPASHESFFNPSLDENIYVCFGDSITYGYIDREPAPELGYPPRLEAMLNQNFGPSLAINQGIGGENTILGLARIDSVIHSQQGRFILIMEGTNDVITPGLAMSTSAANLREIVQRCLQAGVYPVLMTIPPRKDWLGVIPYYSDRILELNQMIRQLVADFPISFVDIYEIFDTYPASDGGLLAVLSNDLKHPSAKGYQVMAESLYDEIKNIPFPPVNIRITSRDGNAVFSFSPDAGFAGRRSKVPLPPAEPTVGTFLNWKDNPKIFDRTRIQGYRIYRKDRFHPQGRFRLLAFVRSPLEYFDPGPHTIDRYVYVLSTVRSDGIEGHCSSQVHE